MEADLRATNEVFALPLADVFVTMPQPMGKTAKTTDMIK